MRQFSDEPVKVEGPVVGEGGWILLQNMGKACGIFLAPATILQAREEGEGQEGPEGERERKKDFAVHTNPGILQSS